MSRSMKNVHVLQKPGSEVPLKKFRNASVQNHPKVGLPNTRSKSLIPALSRSNVSIATSTSMVTKQEVPAVSSKASQGRSNEGVITSSSPAKTTVTMATSRTNLATKHTLSSLQKHSTVSTASKDLKVMFKVLSNI